MVSNRSPFVDTFRHDIAQATEAVSKTCGIPIVVTIRAMGFAIVPENYVAALEKVLVKLDQTEASNG